MFHESSEEDRRALCIMINMLTLVYPTPQAVCIHNLAPIEV